MFRLLFRRADFTVAAILAGTVVALDLLWGLIAGSTGDLAYALVDEPAHLATCAVALLALAAARGRLPAAFVLAALIASVAIDLDHLPGYLGSGLLGGNQPRPDTHSLLLVFFFVGLGLLPNRRLRPIALGIAFGVSTHLLRDLATGPGVPLLWPFDDGASTIPYAVFAALLGVGALMSLQGERRLRPRLVGEVAVVVLIAVGAGVATERPGTALAALGHGVAMGAYIPGATEDPSLIDTYGSEVGRDPVIVSYYRDWTRPLIEADDLNAIWSRGAVPLITWEPWNQNQGQHSKSNPFPLAAIAAGRYDRFIQESAQAAAAWDNPIMLRFAHEMNGGWYPWGRWRNGNTPVVYKAAWRHIVSVFRAEGASNVKWVWTPYVINGHRFPFQRYYPGGKWVDWAGLDGINGGSVFGWRPFSQIFYRSYRQLVRLTRRPLIIAEVASAEAGGDKAAWLARALSRSIPRMPRIRSVVWWADPTDYRGDFGVDSSTSALEALRVGLVAPRYTADREDLLKARSLLPRPHRPRRDRGRGHRHQRGRTRR